MISRKKYQEALKACKQVAKDERKPYPARLRAAELIFLIYGGELPGGSTKRDRKIIRDLIEERTLEKKLKQTVRERLQETVEEQSGKVEQDKVAKALHDFLKVKVDEHAQAE